jgi:hypothetical protein
MKSKNHCQCIILPGLAALAASVIFTLKIYATTPAIEQRVDQGQSSRDRPA